jgi:integrator complex subunit 9
LVKSGLLKVFPSITSKFNDEFNQPCILFVSHPSLRFGEACHFVELWKNSPANSFIFTDPEFNYLDALAPYQPVYANFYYFPIDTSLNTNQVHKLFKETKQISQLITSVNYKISTSEQMYQSEHLSKIDQARLNPSTTVNYYVPNDIIKLNLRRRFENCEIDSDLASIIIPSKRNVSLSKDPGDLSLNGNIAFTTFNAQLVTKNNHHVLKAAPKTIPLMLTKRARINENNLRKFTYGKLNIDQLVKALNLVGFSNIKVVEKESTKNDRKTSDPDSDTLFTDINTESKSYTINIDCNNSINIDLNNNKINVYCDNEDMRNKIKDSLLKCLKTL